MLRSRGADLLFLPPVDELYPDGFVTRVQVPGVSVPLEGARRPGHFDGVATVVLKLFNIVQPDVVAFGRKDAQQCAVIARMARDLDVPVRLVFGETIRESDGLAMSSRNSYLTAEQREVAPVLHRALRAGETALLAGSDRVEAIESAMRAVVAATPGVQIDYLEIVDVSTFEKPEHFDRDLLLVGALLVGRTRLIDNILVRLESLTREGRV